jgi:hypothetical protein
VGGRTLIHTALLFGDAIGPKETVHINTSANGRVERRRHQSSGFR